MADDKYRLQLTGEQVDDALRQLNMRVAEGWAVGTKDGVEVGSSSQYYHNNAKYYAEKASRDISDGVTEATAQADRAESAANRAESAIPSGTAGAVFFDRDLNLTEADASRARANIKNSNPNLLRNWYFVGGGSQLGADIFPINQRGLTTYASTGFTVDGWALSNSNAQLSVNSDCIRLTPTGTSLFRQRVESKEGVYTFSVVMKGSGTLTIRFYNDNATVKASPLITLTDSWTLYSVSVNTNEEGLGPFTLVGLRLTADCQQVDIQKAKLERGAVSTLLLDDKPDFGAELIKDIISTNSASDNYANRLYVGASRENLLVNGWFRINQRGQTVYTTSGTREYTVDMWKISTSNNEAATLTVTDNGITASYPSGASVLAILQILDERLISKVNGQMITFSVMLSNGEVRSGSGIFTAGTSKFFYRGDDLRLYIYSPNANRVQPTIQIMPGNTVEIVAAKLELGMFSTLANDTVPDYTTELIKCQRYFFRVKGVTAGRAYIAPAFVGSAVISNIPTPVTMYEGVTPTATFSGALQVYRTLPSVGAYPLLAITGVRVLTGSVSLLMSIPDGSALTVGNVGFLSFVNNTGYIDISCEPVEV